VTVERLDVARVLVVAEVAARGARRLVRDLETIGGPEIEAVAREAPAGDLGLLVALDDQVIAGADRVGARAGANLDGAGAHDDGGSAPRVGIDPDARARARVDRGVLGVDPRDRMLVGTQDRKNDRAFRQRDL